MIVQTLKAKSIKEGCKLILTECKMAQLSNGDLLHCDPDLGADLVKKYPDHLEKVGLSERATMPSGAKWEAVAATPAIAPTPAKAPESNAAASAAPAVAKPSKPAKGRLAQAQAAAAESTK